MGLTLGLLGAGGGILTVPILVHLLGVPPETATGASLWVAGVVSLVAALPDYARINFRAAIPLAATSAPAAFAARKWLVPGLPGQIGSVERGDALMLLLAGLMAVAGVRMLLASSPPVSRPNVGIGAAAGLVIGLLAGTVGAGGGFLLVPTLTAVLGVPMLRAVPTSLAVIAAQCAGGLAGEHGRPLPWEVLAPVLGVALAGMGAGLGLRSNFSAARLQTLFAGVVLVVALVVAWRAASG
jgi:hypothetical protein